MHPDWYPIDYSNYSSINFLFRVIIHPTGECYFSKLIYLFLCCRFEQPCANSLMLGASLFVSSLVSRLIVFLLLLVQISNKIIKLYLGNLLVCLVFKLSDFFLRFFLNIKLFITLLLFRYFLLLFDEIIAY